MESTRLYVAKETVVSLVANGLVNSAVVWAVFGGISEVPLFGPRGVAIDFIPQLGAITFIGSMVPAILTRSRVKSGKFGAGLAGKTIKLTKILRNSVLAAACVILALGFTSTAILAVFWPGPYTFAQVFALKSIVGCVVPFIITPRAIRWVLSAPSERPASHRP